MICPRLGPVEGLGCGRCGECLYGIYVGDLGDGSCMVLAKSWEGWL